MSKNIQYLNTLFSVCLILLALISCGSLNPTKLNSFPVDHKQFDVLLKKYVDDNGNVNYKGFIEERNRFDQYLNELKNNPPNTKNWSLKEQLAYWINAYNAFTIQLIIDNYPIKSIKDIGATVQIPFVNTPWDIQFIEINGEKYDLNNIEHNILRKNFNEPRIHFAIVCGSYSCPKLRREVYHPDMLETQLTAQARDFLQDVKKNHVKENEIKISKIFSWFKGDFTKEGSLIEFLNQYSHIKIDSKAKISHMDYDWSLNEQE